MMSIFSFIGGCFFGCVSTLIILAAGEEIKRRKNKEAREKIQDMMDKAIIASMRDYSRYQDDLPRPDALN